MQPSINKTTNTTTSTNTTIPTLKLEDAEKRIENAMGHSIQMLSQLKQQNIVNKDIKTADKLIEIYTLAEKKIEATQSQILEKRKESKIYNADITKIDSKAIKKEIEAFNEDLLQANKTTSEIIKQANLDILKVVGKSTISEKDIPVLEKKSQSIDSKVESLAKEGISARWIRFKANVFATDRIALKIFESGFEEMRSAAENRFGELEILDKESLIGLDQDRLKEFENMDIKRRSNVIGINGIYSIGVSFSSEFITKQLKSFTAQHTSEKKRTTITKEIKIKTKDGKEISYTSKHIPLNEEFDKGKISNFFGKLFGMIGISSMNREESHLINAFDSRLEKGGKTILSVIRHGITSQKHEKDPKIRKQKSEQAAKELLMAALLKEIEKQGLTLEQISEKTINLHFNSISLVTPDKLRLISEKETSERSMLEDQLKAIQNFNGENELVFKDSTGKEIKIKVNIKARTFNFGVNKGAMGVTFLNLRFGLDTQYRSNLIAYQGLKKDVEELQEKVKIMNQKEINNPNPPTKEELEYFDQLSEFLVKSEALMKDITLLMKDKKAYLESGNQYEIGAKILNLTNLLDDTALLIKNEDDKEIDGYQVVENCMSGKDRTGWAEAVAKTFAIMESEGYDISHEALENNDDDVRKRFIEILTNVLLEGGGIEITELNTGAKGYKVQNEARLYNEMELKDYLLAKLLAGTTKG